MAFTWAQMIWVFILTTPGVIMLLIGAWLVMYRRKALILKHDTDNDGNREITFVEKLVRYRIVNVDHRKKLHVMGYKERIPYNENSLNPSHSKSFGLVLVEFGGNLFPADVTLAKPDTKPEDRLTPVVMSASVKDPATGRIKADLRPIPYDLKSNFIDNKKYIKVAFTPRGQMMINAGLFLMTLIVCLILMILLFDKMGNIVPQVQSQVQQISGDLSTLKGLIQHVAPN